MALKVDKTGCNHLRGYYGSVYSRGNSRISYVDAAIYFLYVFNLSATMARQGGRVQLKQSDMHLALNMAKMAKGGFSHATIEETQHLIKTLSDEVHEEMKR